MGQSRWDDTYLIHIRELDEQHKVLVSIIDDLDGAMGKGENRDVVGRVIASLMTYTISHFTCEERYFKTYGYPDAEKHILEHDSFVMQVSDFKKAYEAGQRDVSSRIWRFLVGWLVSHIKESDIACAAFLHSKGGM